MNHFLTLLFIPLLFVAVKLPKTNKPITKVETAAKPCLCNKNKTHNSKSTAMEIITSHTWIYDEYYRNCNSDKTLFYKRGNSENYLDMNPMQVKFNEDGTYTEITEWGTSLSGTWEFVENETKTIVHNSMGTFTATIELLENDRLEWYDDFNSNGTYGKMIPLDCASSQTLITSANP